MSEEGISEERAREDGSTFHHKLAKVPKRSAPNLGISMVPGDHELLNYITDYLGCSRSEAARTAIRSFAAHLAFIAGSRQK